jgi:hypothetical protein
MKTAVNSETDEKKSMLDGGPDGEAQRSYEGGPRHSMDEQGRQTPRRVPNGGWTGARWRRTGARRKVGVARWRPRWVPDGGGVLGGGPTEEYINGGDPQFWPLFSNAQSHLLEL